MARCRRDCYDSNTGQVFCRGVEYDVTRSHPLAKFFDLPAEPVAAPPVETPEDAAGPDLS